MTPPLLFLKRMADKGAFTDLEKNNNRVKRGNTIEEKRRIRNERKKRKRKNGVRKRILKVEVSGLKNELEAVKWQANESNHKIKVLRSMCQTFWERWHWELEKRKKQWWQIPYLSILGYLYMK